MVQRPIIFFGEEIGVQVLYLLSSKTWFTYLKAAGTSATLALSMLGLVRKRRRAEWWTRWDRFSLRTRWHELQSSNTLGHRGMNGANGPARRLFCVVLTRWIRPSRPQPYNSLFFTDTSQTWQTCIILYYGWGTHLDRKATVWVDCARSRVDVSR